MHQKSIICTQAVDFVRLSRGAMTYIFHGMFDGREKENEKQTFESFNDTLRLCLTMHFNADAKPHTAETKHRAATLMEQVTQTMSLIEMSGPLILFDRLLHELLHMPGSMLKWNSCRNYWAFKSERYDNNHVWKHAFYSALLGELAYKPGINHHILTHVTCRYVGWITNFIRQRNHAAASMASSYSRLTFVRRMPPVIRLRLQHRQLRGNMTTAMRGYIAPYTPFVGRGSGKLYAKPRNWRNSRPMSEHDRDRVKGYTHHTSQKTVHICVFTYFNALNSAFRRKKHMLWCTEDTNLHNVLHSRYLDTLTYVCDAFSGTSRRVACRATGGLDSAQNRGHLHWWGEVEGGKCLHVP